jgi:hypothetical protein
MPQMAKPHYQRKKKREKNRLRKKTTYSASAILPKKSFLIRFWESLISPKGVISVIAILFGLFTGYYFLKDKIHEWITPKETLWEEKNYVSGVTLPIEIVKQFKKIEVSSGSNGAIEMLDINRMKEGVEYSPKGFSYNGSIGGPFGLKLLLKGNKLFVATTFKDIDDNYVGELYFDRWKARSQYISNYHDGDDNMEIIDTHNNVLFSMQYVYPNRLVLKGYSNTIHYILVADTGLLYIAKLEPDYKRNSIQYIQKIKKINTY